MKHDGSCELNTEVGEASLAPSWAVFRAVRPQTRCRRSWAQQRALRWCLCSENQKLMGRSVIL